jgi:IS5 family transposase
MRHQLLALSLSAAVAAVLAPGLMHAQTREACIGRVADCVRRDAIERRLERQRTLVVDREVRAELRARIREDRSRERAMDRADRARERRERARVDRRLRIRYRDE